MNVAFVIQDTGKLYGAERATLDLISWLNREAGLDPVLCLIEETRLGLERSDIRDKAAELGLHVVSFPVDRAFSWKLIRQIRKFSREEDVDLFHVTGPKAVFHTVPAVWRRGIPCIATVHGWLFRKELKEQIYTALDCFMLRRCARVIVLSRHYQHLLLEQRIEAERLIRIPTGIEKIPSPDTTRKDSAVFTVGFAGRMSEEKQPEIMLELAVQARAKEMPIQFKLAGDGHLLESLKEKSGRLGLNHIVDFVGYVPSETFLPELDLLVNCSTIENLPYSILEAMRLGIPVVAFDTGGISDLVEDGENGFLVPAGDTTVMSGKIEQLASDKVLCRQMGIAGRQKVYDEFSPVRVVKAHKGLYESCLQETRGLRSGTDKKKSSKK